MNEKVPKSARCACPTTHCVKCRYQLIQRVAWKGPCTQVIREKHEEVTAQRSGRSVTTMPHLPFMVIKKLVSTVSTGTNRKIDDMTAIAFSHSGTGDCRIWCVPVGA